MELQIRLDENQAVFASREKPKKKSAFMIL